MRGEPDRRRGRRPGSPRICLYLRLNLGPNLGQTMAAAGLLPLRKTVQNDDFDAPRGASSRCGERPPDKRPWKGTPCCGL
jgi:hypothetical protein